MDERPKTDEDAPIATATRVPPDFPDSGDDERDPIATATRIPPL